MPDKNYEKRKGHIIYFTYYLKKIQNVQQIDIIQ